MEFINAFNKAKHFPVNPSTEDKPTESSPLKPPETEVLKPTEATPVIPSEASTLKPSEAIPTTPTETQTLKPKEAMKTTETTGSEPKAKDKGKAILTEEPKKKKSMPQPTEKLMKSSFDAIRTPKPEEEDWAYGLNPLSDIPSLDPKAKPTGRVAEVIRQMDTMRRQIPPPAQTQEEMEEVVYKYLYKQAFETNPLPLHVNDPRLSEEFDNIFTRTKPRPRSEVNSIYKIKKVIYCKFSQTRTTPTIKYNLYRVRRDNNSETTFSDADIRNLNPYDLPDLLKWTKENYNTKENIRAYQVFRKAMREKLLLYSLIDFQTGKDLKVKRLCLRPPDDRCPPDAVPNSIITSPRYGLVFLNPRGERKLFVTMDCQKYATSTLNKLRAILVEHRGTERMNRTAADAFIRDIDATIRLRELCINFYKELREVGFDNRKYDDFNNADV